MQIEDYNNFITVLADSSVKNLFVVLPQLLSLCIHACQAIVLLREIVEIKQDFLNKNDI